MSEYSSVCVCVCVCVPAHACVLAFLHILILPVKSGNKKMLLNLSMHWSASTLAYKPCLTPLSWC